MGPILPAAVNLVNTGLRGSLTKVWHWNFFAARMRKGALVAQECAVGILLRRGLIYVSFSKRKSFRLSQQQVQEKCSFRLTLVFR